MQKRINKPKWAPTHYRKQVGEYGPIETYGYKYAYIDEYGLTLVYRRENVAPRFASKRYFSSSVYFYENEKSQGLKLSNIITEELANGYEKNAQALLWRNPKIKNFDDLIKAIKKDEEAER